MKFKFKEEFTFEQRKTKSSAITSKWPDRIPVIVEKHLKSGLPDIDRRDFMTPNDLSVAQFMYIIRRRICLPPHKALFLYVGRVLPTTSATMGQIAAEHKAEDGFLYAYYTGEETLPPDDDDDDK